MEREKGRRKWEEVSEAGGGRLSTAEKGLERKAAHADSGETEERANT